VFAIVRVIPGDPARLLAGDFATEQIVDELRAKWRLNDPLPVQYAAYIGGLVRGDFGRSITTSTPILPELTERFLRTLELAVAGILVSIVIGGAAGIVSAVRRSSLIDYAATALALTGISTPILTSANAGRAALQPSVTVASKAAPSIHVRLEFSALPSPIGNSLSKGTKYIMEAIIYYNAIF